MSRIGRISLGSISTPLVAYVFLGLTRVTVCPPTMDASAVSVGVVERGLLPHDLFSAPFPSGFRNGLYVERPSHAEANSSKGLFKLSPDGGEAIRVEVKLGRAAKNSIEVLNGLKEGNKIIVSDMSVWEQSDRIRLK